MIFRFVSALGIGGEMGGGGQSLLTETWPRACGPLLAAVLQCGVNLGILIAAAFVWLNSLLPTQSPTDMSSCSASAGRAGLLDPPPDSRAGDLAAGGKGGRPGQTRGAGSVPSAAIARTT